MSSGMDVSFSGFTTVGAVLDDGRRFAERAADQLWDLTGTAGECAACPPLPLEAFSLAWAEPLSALAALMSELADRVRAAAVAYAQIDADAQYRFGAVSDVGA